MYKKISFIFAIAIFGIVAGYSATLAQSEENAAVEALIREESISAENLGVVEPTLLPSSPFYFFKNFTRRVEKIFTFNPVKKIELELRFADEKIIEAKMLVETSPKQEETIKKAVTNYQASQEELKKRLEGLRETSQNPNIDKLLEKVADRTVKHEKLFSELKAKFEDKEDIKKQIEMAKEKIAESAVEAAKKDNAQNFARKLEKAFIETRGSDLKHLGSIEIIDSIHEKAGKEFQDKLLEVRKDFSLRLKEDIESFVIKNDKEAPEFLKEAIAELPGDKSRRLIIIEEIKAVAEKEVKNALEDAEKRLEKVFEEREETEKHATETYKRAEDFILKLEKKIKEFSQNIPVSVTRLLEEAKAHFANSQKAYEAKKFGEAFGQARSSEVLARNALRMLEEQKEPEGESIKKDISELAERLANWEKKLESLGDELRLKAKSAFENTRLNLRLAEEAIKNNDLRLAKKRFEEAKGFERLIERIFKEAFKKEAREAAPATASPTSVQPALRLEEKKAGVKNRCEDFYRRLNELNNLLRENKISPSDHETKYIAVKKELGICLQNTATPEPTAPTISAPAERTDIICTQEYDPVCGENGKTYPNACYAKVTGVLVKFRGACDKQLEESTIKQAPSATTEPTRIQAADTITTTEVKTTTDLKTTAVASSAGSAAEIFVTIDETGRFNPSSVKIVKGGKVAWINKNVNYVWPASGVHPTHEIYPGFDALRKIGQGENYSFTFEKVGSWKYHDHLNPASTGVVEVTE